MVRRNRLVEWLAVLAGGLLIVYLLFTKPFVGVADNGDFLRLMGAAGIFHMAEPGGTKAWYFSHAHSVFAYGPWFKAAYPSSQLVLVMAASLIARVVDWHVFDIRVLGAIYSVFLLAAYYLLIRYNKIGRWPADLLLAAAIVFVFTDIGYTAYFNSFFGEPYSLLAMLLTAALAVAVVKQDKPDRRWLVGFFVAALLLATSKIQNAPIGALLGLLTLRFAALHGEYRWKRTAIRLAFVLIGCSIVMYAAAPKEFKYINLYQSVFYGILKDSPDPARDLTELGVSDTFAVNAGTNYFQRDAPIPQNDPSLKTGFYGKLSHIDTAAFYVKHPGRFVQKLERAAENGMSVRPYYLGNFEKSEGAKPGALSFAFSGWSEFKHRVLPHSLWFVGGFFALYFAVLLLHYVQRSDTRQRLYIEIFAVVGLVGIFSFTVPLIGDGEADLGKHLFLFNVCFDMMAIVCWGYIIKLLTWGVSPVRR